MLAGMLLALMIEWASPAPVSTLPFLHARMAIRMYHNTVILG